VKNGTKEIGISTIITIDDLCTATFPFNLFTVKLKPPGQQNEVTIFKYQLASATTTTLYTETPAGGVNILATFSLSGGRTFQQGFYFEITMLLSTILSRIQVTTGSGSYARNSGPHIRNFGDWKLDETTRFEFCTDSSGVNVASCTVSSLAIEYEFSPPLIQSSYQYLGGIHPVLFASYSLDQKSGFTVIDDANSLGPAKLGIPI